MDESIDDDVELMTAICSNSHDNGELVGVVQTKTALMKVVDVPKLAILHEKHTLLSNSVTTSTCTIVIPNLGAPLIVAAVQARLHLARLVRHHVNTTASADIAERPAANHGVLIWNKHFCVMRMMAWFIVKDVA